MSDDILEVTIEALGADGDGIARLPHGGSDGATVFVPFALPGERVRVRVHSTPDGLRGTLVDVLQPSPDRMAAACRHFGACGGCVMEHLAEAPYRAWKRGLLTEALARAGLLDAPVADLVAVPPGSRRRATFFAHRQADGGVKLGFQARASHDVVDLTDCAALVPALNALLAPLRDLLKRLLPPGARAEAVVNALDSGLDVLLRTPGKALPPPIRQMLTDFAAARDLARVSWQSMMPGTRVEPVAARRTPHVLFGAVPVTPPPGAFLQATQQGEEALRREVLAAAAGAKRVADLFCGAGAFALPLAAAAQVHAIDGDAALAGALRKAADAAGIGGRVTSEVRDLMKRPLIADELKRYDAVVFDPPRAGAASQAGRLAASKIPVVVAVSCNPATFARDAKLLVEGGYRLEKAVPVDQFVWTPHLEIVAVFRRSRAGR